jgi:hypothetical protein
MNLHLAEISLTVAPDAHAVLIMDQAGRECLAVHARQLALEPRLQVI